MKTLSLFFYFYFSIVNICFTKNTRKDLDVINRQIKDKKLATEKLENQKKILNKEIKDTQNKLVAVAKDIKKYELQLSLYDKKISSLLQKKALLDSKIKKNNIELVKIISAFESIAQVPKGYLFFSGDKISSIFNSSILLKSLIHSLDESKKLFQKDLEELEKIKNEIITSRESVKVVNNKVKTEKNKISGLINVKKQKQKQLNERQIRTTREMNKLISESKTIEEFLKKAEALRLKQNNKSFINKKFTGNKPMPVIGNIKTYFGENRTTGVKSKGIYLSTSPGLQVVAPNDADVVFAGNFYGYKNLLILHTIDNYYIIIGGMDIIVVDEGQNVLAGEPIGETGKEDFYIEIREKSTPVNPLKYFRI